MSFAQEMKDFLGASQSVMKTFDDHNYKQTLGKQLQASTEKTIAETPDDEDDALDKKLKQAQINHMNQSGQGMAALRALQQQKLQNDIKLQNRTLNPQPDPIAAAIPSAASAPPPVFQPTPDQAPAAPAVGPQSDASDSIPDDASGSDANYAASGGAIQPVSAIPSAPGIVDDGDDSEDDDDSDDNTSQGNPTQQFSQQAAHDAVAGGLQELHDRFGMTYDRAGAIGGGQANYHGYARGQGAAPLADMDQIYKKIDPNNQMSDSQRNMAALSAVWQYKLSHGDPEGAKRAAAMMLQHYRLASQRYAAIAAVAGQNGNADLAAKAAMKAYANIPDGKNLQVTKDPQSGQLMIQYTDQNGKLIHGGLMTPQQLGAQAMGVATKGFDQFLMQSAGQQPPKGAIGGNAGPKPLKPADQAKDTENLDSAYTNAFPAQDAQGNAVPQPTSDEAMFFKGTLHRMAQNPKNADLTPDEMMNYSKQALATNAKDPSAMPFNATKIDDDEGGGYELRFGKRPPVYVDSNTYDDIIDRRAAKVAAAKSAKDKSDAAAKKPGIVSDVANAVSDYADDLEKNAPKQVYPGGTYRDDNAPTEAIPSEPRKDSDRPYVPFMAGGR